MLIHKSGVNPVLFLVFPELSAMIRGMDNGADLLARDYSEDDLDKDLDEIFKTFF